MSALLDQLTHDQTASPSPSSESEFCPSPPLKRARQVGAVHPRRVGVGSASAPATSTLDSADSAQPQKVKRRRNRKHNSCEPCRMRKVKCDRLANCSNCRLHGQVCHYVDATPISTGDDDELAQARDEIARLRALVGMLAKQIGVGASVDTLLDPPEGGLRSLLSASSVGSSAGGPHLRSPGSHTGSELSSPPGQVATSSTLSSAQTALEELNRRGSTASQHSPSLLSPPVSQASAHPSPPHAQQPLIRLLPDTAAFPAHNLVPNPWQQPRAHQAQSQPQPGFVFAPPSMASSNAMKREPSGGGGYSQQALAGAGPSNPNIQQPQPHRTAQALGMDFNFGTGPGDPSAFWGIFGAAPGVGFGEPRMG